ncbi:MAG: hypothetical protein GFH27_549279n15 [Chloroflexi bacterium AL-W]|nr:hypothetical protein [Chloroflexi bacterium AL-N1]NOK71024.1 hypothetical protein [Chloroflexi bacterium AL-N10]NOK72753.1 hypothetical protein [Chloroflexi bacterium AL-N5]NOK79160.1 hypothetical protein [Chloroflexi bacterium AL-W]NOK87074.1 hypothetical protein [Chloroflexi bacterium AL-N15]
MASGTSPHSFFTSFVGRSYELDAISTLVNANRLVTLTGTGGIGKNRLAWEFVNTHSSAFPDGVIWVALASVTDPAMVLPTIAKSLDITDSSSQPLWESVCSYLAQRKMLIVLDNMEQLREVFSLVADLLTMTTHLTLLVTSRESLHMAGEQIYPVPPLTLPEHTTRSSLDVLEQVESVQLFVKRAQAVRPDFALTPTSAPLVAEICQRLDGLPLAIELVAAWIHVLPPQSLLAHLDTYLLNFKNRAHGMPDRHQTLCAAIDWSYDLLDADEQQLLARLAVFAGSWSLEAAEAVCATNAIEKTTLLERLTTLLDKSLVVQPQLEGEPRFRMLATIREYAAERLGEHGEIDFLQQRHAHFFRSFVEQAEPELRGSQQDSWFARLIADCDNIRKALRWTIDVEDLTTAFSLAGSLWRFWWIQGYLAEGRTWLTLVLSMPGQPSINPVLRANVLSCAANLASLQGDLLNAQKLHEEGLTLRRMIGDREAIARSLNNLGLVAEQQEDYPTAASLYKESLALWRETGDLWGIADVLNNLGWVVAQQGDVIMARALHEESLTLKREVGDTWGIASALGNLGNLATQHGDYAAAWSYHQESLTLKQSLGNQQGIAGSLNGLAEIAVAFSQYERAVLLSGAASAMRDAISVALPPSDQIGVDNSLAVARSHLSEEAFIESWEAGQALTLEEAITLAQEALSAPRTVSIAPAPAPDLHTTLTPREREVLCLVAVGLTNKEIAQKLVLSHYTVQDYVRSILDKLDVPSRSAATRYAVEYGLVADFEYGEGTKRDLVTY